MVINDLSKKRFDYWGIYEYNECAVLGKFDSVDKFQESRELYGNSATIDDGGIHTLFAKFLLAEEKLSRYSDYRINFVGVKDEDKDSSFF